MYFSSTALPLLLQGKSGVISKSGTKTFWLLTMATNRCICRHTHCASSGPPPVSLLCASESAPHPRLPGFLASCWFGQWEAPTGDQRVGRERLGCFFPILSPPWLLPQYVTLFLPNYSSPLQLPPQNSSWNSTGSRNSIFFLFLLP